jgi:hypothetical protein
MKIQVFIFNYSRFQQSNELLKLFDNEKIESFIINCHHENDPNFEETNKIIKLPNLGYSGQWNKTLEIANCDVLLIVNSDVLIPSIKKLIKRMKLFYEYYENQAGVYAPNVDWTTWSFNPYSLEKIKFGFRKVPGTDSTIWSLRQEIALQVGKIDLEKNHLGWGIENLASYFSHKNNKLVVRDYKIKCKHPNESLYSRENAMKQFENWIDSLKIDKEYFWQLYKKREDYEFGSNKDEKIFK